MTDLVSYRTKKYNQFLNHYCSPGPEGILGDVNQNVRLQQTDPDAPPRFLLGVNELQNRGANIQDGDYASYSNNALHTSALVRDYYNSKMERVSNGFLDTTSMNLYTCTNPIVQMVGRPLESWNITQAQTINALSTGRAFQPLPGGYAPRGLPRGPMPQSMNIVGADVISYANIPEGPVGQPVGQPFGVVQPPVGQPEGIVQSTPGQACPTNGCTR